MRFKKYSAFGTQNQKIKRDQQHDKQTDGEKNTGNTHKYRRWIEYHGNRGNDQRQYHKS